MRYLFGGQEMKSWEKQAMEVYHVPSLLLMEQAAAAVIRELLEGGYDLHRVLIICGTGNNGGDGLAAARMLHTDGIRTEVLLIGEKERMTEETHTQYEMYEAFSGKFVTMPDYREYTVIVDAFLGIGCSRELTGAAKEMVEAVNETKARVVAVDLPSGISADSGKLCGCAVKADTTVTFFAEKLGMALYPGREYCGEVRVIPLGIPKSNMEACSAITYGAEDLRRLPKRKPVSHKGTYGKALVIAGSEKISGAAYLSAAGAYRIGAGLVKIYTPKENLFAMQTLLPEALLETYDRKAPDTAALLACMEWADVIVIGPGFGTDLAAEKLFRTVMGESRVPVVIDADGLNLAAKDKSILADSKAPLVLTPHLQEMARLLGVPRETFSGDLGGAADAFAGEYPVTLVLKDAATLVVKKNEKRYVNKSGNPGMATGGSGDVLAGIIGGLIAQGMEPLEAARLGVYVHGAAGDAAAAEKGVYGMTATDLLEGIGKVTKL